MWMVGSGCKDDPRYWVSPTSVWVSSGLPTDEHSSINCRLPQTPRTPTAAAAHYFDDVFSKPNGTKPKIRRSSTTRSIGNRSTFHVSTNGDTHDEDDDELYEKERRRSEANEHVANYVTEQLERIQSNESVFDEDEFEAQLE